MYLDHGTPKPLFPYPGVDDKLENVPSKDQQGKGPAELTNRQTTESSGGKIHDHCPKPLCWGMICGHSKNKLIYVLKTEGRRRGWQRMRWLDGITDSVDVFEQTLGDGEGQGSLTYHRVGHKRLNNNMHFSCVTWSKLANLSEPLVVLPLNWT